MATSHAASAAGSKKTSRTVTASSKSRRAPSTAAVRSGEATERALRETFNQLNHGRSGHLPLNLIGVALRMNNQCPTEAELGKIIEDHAAEHADEVDSDATPEIDFDEFCVIMRAYWRSRDQLLEEISAAFGTFDKGDTGVVGADEMRMRLTSLGEVLDEAAIAEMLKDANVVEGNIPYTNLAKLLLDAYSRPVSKKPGKKKGGATSGRSGKSRK